MYILGVESSCDESAASVVKAGRRQGPIAVLSNIISSQIDIHKKYGGVVPEIAAREHVLNILPVIDEALEKAGLTPKDIDYLAVTKGPGLVTSLMAGLETVRALAFAWNKPVIEINHIEGHIYSNFIAPKSKIIYPAIIMTVSGGHTNLVLMDKEGKIKIVGEALDDAAGEAYDKGAKMLGLGYPGGPVISRYAREYAAGFPDGQAKTDISLPRPMLNGKSLDFSFSGLKTALLYKLQKDPAWPDRIPEYCFAFQEAIIDILAGKTVKAARKYGAKTAMLSGGVSANQELRERLEKTVAKELPGVGFLVPERIYTTDNATMIATAAVFKVRRGAAGTDYRRLRVDPSLQLK